MITAVVELLARRHTELGLPAVCSASVLGLDRDPAGKVTLILYGDDGTPVAVAKTTRDEDQAALLRQEHDALVAIDPGRLARTARQVPRAVLLERVAGREVLVTSAVTGSPLLVRYHQPHHAASPSRVRADLTTVEDWLTLFQGDTAQGTLDCRAAFLAHAGPVLDRYRRAHGWGAAEADLLAHLEQVARLLTGVPVPVVAVHGDLCLGNVLVRAHGVTGVVDWELGRASGLPFTDLLKFAASYGSFLDRALPMTPSGPAGHPGWGELRDRWAGRSTWPNLAGLLYAFTGTGWFPGLVQDYLAAAYRRLGVPAVAGELFLPLFVAEQATTLYDPRYRNGYRDVLQILAELLPTHGAWRRAVG